MDVSILTQALQQQAPASYSFVGGSSQATATLPDFITPDWADPTSVSTSCPDTETAPVPSWATDAPKVQMVVVDHHPARPKPHQTIPPWLCEKGGAIDSFQAGWYLIYRERLTEDIDELERLNKIEDNLEACLKHIRHMQVYAFSVHPWGDKVTRGYYLAHIRDALRRASADLPEWNLTIDEVIAQCRLVVRRVDAMLKDFPESTSAEPTSTNAAGEPYNGEDSFSIAWVMAAVAAAAV